jgi:hypothetical protein
LQGVENAIKQILKRSWDSQINVFFTTKNVTTSELVKS